MKLNAMIASLTVGVAAVALPACCMIDSNTPCSYTQPNEAYYTDGKLDEGKVKDAYFSMMKHFNYPIFPVLKTKEFWVTDFTLGDFSKVGMGGIFWMNNNYKGGGYLGHEIYLLPGQMIVEHAHVATKVGPAKRESWLVRHGSVYSFSVQDEPMAGVRPLLPVSQTSKGFITCNSWKMLKAGENDTLNKEGAKHFLIAGPEGAIVTETGNFHDNDGLRFTNPNAKL